MDKKKEEQLRGSVDIRNMTKVYHLFERPLDRLKEAFSVTGKRYSKDHYALKNINLHIDKGESIGILGTNGSGKSTLLKLITGVVTQTEGEIEAHGKIAAMLELGAGFNYEYTGLENIYLNGTMMGYTEEEMKKRVPDIIEFADIGDFLYQPVKTYSSGMFSRLAFAVSTNVEPDILIVDEALSVGDARFQEKCIDKMKQLREGGTTILFVTHAIEQVKRFCTRAIWLKNGELVEDGEASHVVDMFDNFMKYGEQHIEDDFDDDEFCMPEDVNCLAAIKKVKLNKKEFHSFEELEVSVVYDIYTTDMEDFQVGVAIYSQDRSIYVYGPNTNLDKVPVPQAKGRHEVIYKIPSLTLLSGNYVIDVGVFNSDGIVNLDYRSSCQGFFVTNEYFAEGVFHLEHQWLVTGGENNG